VAVPGRKAGIGAFQRRLLDGLRPWATGGVYLNFMGTDDTAPERVQAAFRPVDHQRLAALKAVYDPNNRFRRNFNVPPRRAGQPA
jgi:FAD/FMN-containing dehydrogenase